MTKSDTDIVSYVFIGFLVVGLWAHRPEFLTLSNIALLLIAVLVVKAGFKLLRKVRSFRSSAIDTMSGLEFEKYVARLLKQNGYRHVRITEEYDLGVDIVAAKNGITWGIQVKRYSGLVGANAVRQVVTALPMYHCDKAMVITNSIFSRPAVALAHANNCVLVGKRGLSRLMRA